MKNPNTLSLRAHSKFTKALGRAVTNSCSVTPIASDETIKSRVHVVMSNELEIPDWVNHEGDDAPIIDLADFRKGQSVLPGRPHQKPLSQGSPDSIA